jgi:hypothetical protein
MSRHEISEPQRRDWRMLSYGAALLAPAAVLLVAWPRLASNLFANGFAEQMFMPHGMCYLWVPQLYFMHVSSDLLIGLSYVAISSTLIYLIYRARHDIPFHGSFWPLELHGSVDELARDLLALRVCQTPDRGGFGGDRRRATFPRSQGSHAVQAVKLSEERRASRLRPRQSVS